MNSYQLFCGTTSIILGGDKPEDVVAIEYGDNLIKDCLDGKLSGNFWISCDADNLLEIIKKQFKYIEAAGGYVLNEVGQGLVILRNGLWDLPKGKVEPGETVELAAVREVMEETGVTEPKIVKKIADTYHFYRWGTDPTIIFKKTYWYSMSYSGDGKTSPQTEEGISLCGFVDDSMIDEMLNKTHRNLKILFQLKKDGKL